jgi:ABC-type nickel/cobalt efflux system permease component RcnA
MLPPRNNLTEVFNPAYIGIVMIGLLHGLEPGHGWPVAVLYSVKKGNPVASAVLSSGIVGLGHLISSIAVVIAYVLLQSWLNFDAPWLKYAAAAVLVALAVKLFAERTDGIKNQHGHLHEDYPEGEHEHEHEHPGGKTHHHRHKHTLGAALSLLGLASFAFVLGFAHEEEFALLALAAGGVNAWVLMISYGLSVLLGLVVVTVAGVRAYKYLQARLARYEKYVPKISAAILAIMAFVVVIW